jgi:hypothetical protein
VSLSTEKLNAHSTSLLSSASISARDRCLEFWLNLVKTELEEGASRAWWPWRAREVAGGGHGRRAGGWRGQEGGRELYRGEGRMGAPTVEGEGCAGSTMVRIVSVRPGIDKRGGGEINGNGGTDRRHGR